MKNLNLIKRLWTDSHEKQKPQRFARYAAILIMLLTLGVGQMWASTTVTLYYAVSSSTVGSYKVKCYYNFGYSQTGLVDMTKTDYSYKTMDVYSVQVTAGHDNANEVDFQLFNGDSYQSQQRVMTGWVAVSGYASKIYVHNIGWKDLAFNSTLYWANTSDASGDVKAYAWNSEGNNGTFPGAAMTPTGKKYNGHNIYTITFDNPPYPTVIFSAGGSSHQTGNLSIGTGQLGKMYLGRKGGWTDYVYDQDVTVSDDGNGSVSPTGTVSLHVSGTSLTATPNTNYVFDHWAISGGGISPSSSSTNPQSFTATTTGGTIQAVFDDDYCIKGNGGIMGNWDTYLGLPNTASNTFSKTYTLTKGITYIFKVHKRSSNTYWGNTKGSGNISIDRSKSGSAQSVSTAGGVSDNITITPDVTGDYTFTFNSSTPSLTVTYPASKKVTYSAVLRTGSGDYKSADPTAVATGSIAVTSNDYVLAGKTVTFTAAAANAGYTFHGWYSTSTPTIGTTTPLSSDTDADNNKYTYSVAISSSDITVYAVYTEDMHDVTVNAQTGGTVSYNGGAAGSSCTARAGIATASANIVATASDGYYFAGWLLPDGTITKATESTYNGATSTYTIRATADSKTVTALFNVRYALLGSQDAAGNPKGGMPGWGEGNEAPFAYSDGTYTKTVDLTVPNVNYKFRIVDRRGATHTSYGLSSKAVIAADGDYHDVASTANDAQLATAGVGTYTLYVQTNGSGKPKVKITNPASHLITMGTKTDFGADDAAGGSISAVDGEDTPNPIVSGNYIKAGGDIVVTAEKNTGYTFDGWYSDASCTIELDDDKDEEDLTYTKTDLGGNLSIYAKFTENRTTVNLAALHGKIQYWDGDSWEDAPSSESVGVYTTCSIKAIPDSGYYFTGWTKTVGTDYTISSTSTAAITLSGNGGGSTSGQTLTADFDKRWIIAGDWEKDGGGSWVMSNKMDVSKLSNVTFASKRIDGLTANTDYDFKLYDLTAGTHWVGFASDGEIFEYGEDSVLVNTYPGSNITLKTAAQGNYYFYYNLKTHKLNISFPASRQVTMGTRTISDGITSAYTGGTISAVDEDENVITNGLYIASGADITFTASPKAGYIWRGWYDNEYTYGAPIATERVHTDNDVTDIAFTRYGLFEEALYTVTVHRSDVIETTVKVGVDTKPAITASTAPTGKVFDRWVTTGSATVEDPYSSTTTITGATDNASTVTATFKDLPKIYIDLTAATGWSQSKMYVVFYKNDGYFDENKGTGLSSTYVINALPLEMTKMDVVGKNIWYYSYDPTSGDFEGQTITCVAFVDHTFEANYGNFTSATVVYRTDFSSCMNMFVVTDNTGTNKNTTCYYRNTNAIAGDAGKGYWRKYEEKNSGFYLNNLPGGSVEFTNEDGGNSYTAVANLDANTTYYFYLGGCNGWNWSNNNGTYPFNYDNPTRNLETYNNVSEDQYRCKLRTTAAGYYTFMLTPQNTRNLQVSVAFPVATGDYRAIYNNAESSPTVSRPSNIIKNDQNSGTISLWLNKGTNYISFQNASVASPGGAVTWSACGSQQTVSDVPDAGIYTMTLTKSNTTYTVSTPEKYEGGLYIRTDCAPGKWADYTENRLDENTFNFDATDPNSYDYYYCKWINDAGTNVRCVIANDYNVAISDTLKTEAILGGGETLPEGANVRFSYNSLTNTLKRSYLTGASTDVFLNIMPDAASTVYKSDGETDMYNSGAVGATNKFSDLGNWVYEMDVKVKPNATAAVKANYNSTSQALIAAKTKLVGGTGSDLYSIRLVYDFRTNYLMSAWMPNNDNITTSISLNSDMMIVRRGQNNAKQLSFTEGSLTDVKRAYGVFEFNKSEMVTRMGSWSDGGYTYGLCMYYFSLPFDVNVADIFGVGTMGDDWRIQFYNGTKRAAKGWFAGDGTTTFWEDVPADTVLHAYEGYCLMLNRSHFNSGSHAVWNNVTTNAYLYFPSVAPVSALADNDMEITVPSHECKIDRFFDQDKAKYYDEETKTWSKGARNHKYVDSHWNLMGTPLFETAKATGVAGCKVTIGDADSTLTYIYEWVPSTNSLSARQVLNTDFTFKPMYAYMVQYSGKVTFTGASITPASIAARRTSENKQYTIDLLLTKEDQFAGRTYVELRENAVDSFMLNEDMYMMKGSKIGDIYTHADGYELAANVLSVNSHIVPVSIDAKAAGTYTISMPSNFSGTVTLIDKYAQTRTDLGLEDYEIYLESGTISDRFELEINISKVPTAIDGVDGGSLKDGKAHKFIMNGVMYILENGRLFDARGNRVK